ncbi:hypothetical protein [Nocardioides sp. Soil805]|uniref:hypothetical protein n=1 Tax=Nocardioides sp. Soil805 TaxID=1736416 RepID=UPI0007031A49|nr:hypothetical protein [Nocardioides sp. Soil805]KRF36540.1 hypothetical protein ASG94_03590 [Nocardioides sp. Soil805]
MRRSLVVGLLAGSVLGLGACTSSPSGPEPGTTRVARLDGCDGVAHDEVRGPEPGEPHGSLREYRADDAVCDAWWLDLPDDFVPQGLEVAASTAYVVGHRSGEVGSKPCQVAAVALPSGETRAFAARLDPPGSPGRTAYCRHGGGAALTGAGLWVVETSRLWLLDPERLDGAPVLRVWQLGEGVRGSTTAATRGRLVIAGYRPDGPGRARWYDESALLRPGVTTLVEDGAGAGQVAMRRSTRVPARLQGLAFTRAGISWAVSSGIACGVVRPGGPPRDFVPGAEDLVVDRRSIWAVSEASAPPYRDPEGALVPRLLRLDREAVEDGGPATCDL